MSTAEEFTSAEVWDVASGIVANRLEDIEGLEVSEALADKFADDERFAGLDEGELDKLTEKVSGYASGICDQLGAAVDQAARELRNRAEQTP